MDYSQLSDFEINKRVSDVFWPDINKSPECNNKTFPQNSSVVYMDNGYGGFSRDYCNNPADAWRILNRNRIEITVHYGPDGASGGLVCYTARAPYGDGDYVLVQDTNHLRAGMIAFLMQQDKS